MLDDAAQPSAIRDPTNHPLQSVSSGRRQQIRDERQRRDDSAETTDTVKAESDAMEELDQMHHA